MTSKLGNTFNVPGSIHPGSPLPLSWLNYFNYDIHLKSAWKLTLTLVRLAM